MKSLAVGPGREVELGLPGGVKDAVAVLHVVRVDVREPADTAAGDGLEELAVGVEVIEVVLLLRD